jgi:hypothetical protein
MYQSVDKKEYPTIRDFFKLLVQGPGVHIFKSQPKGTAYRLNDRRFLSPLRQASSGKINDIHINIHIYCLEFR